MKKDKIEPVLKTDSSLKSVDVYEKMSEELPEREIDIDIKEPRSLEDAEADLSNVSDLQATLQRLFPKFDNDDINSLAQVAMVSRIAPDIFLDQLWLTVVSILEKNDPRDKIDVMSTVNLVYYALSIGIDGKGRIDGIELQGSSKESAEFDSLTSRLGV